MKYIYEKGTNDIMTCTKLASFDNCLIFLTLSHWLILSTLALLGNYKKMF